MRPSRRKVLLASFTASLTASLVVGAVGFTPKAGLAQDGAGAAVPQLAPMLGGQLPAPTYPVAITWDPRYKSDPTQAALVGQYLVIEGDIILGTVDDVTKAQRNAIAAKAQRFSSSVDLNRLALPEDVRKSAADLLRSVAAQPQEKTSLTADSTGVADLARLLREIQHFDASHRALRSRAPEIPRTSFTNDVGEALDRLRSANQKSAAPGLVAPRPEGDPGQADAFGLIGSQYYWPGGVVPYYIDPGYEPYRAVFEQACALWTRRTTAVSFRPYRAGDGHYLYVQLVGGDAGSSTVGMRPEGPQWMNLIEPSRFPDSHIAHELGHALGLFHEQSRPDAWHVQSNLRDSAGRLVPPFIVLDTNNIANGWLSQFSTPAQPFSTFDSGFDYFSIMLYDSRAGSVNPFASAGPFPSRPAFPVYDIPQYWKDYYAQKYQGYRLDTDVVGLGNTKVPSRLDVATVNKIYQGPANAAPATGVTAPAPAGAALAQAGPGATPKPPGPAFPSHPSAPSLSSSSPAITPSAASASMAYAAANVSSATSGAPSMTSPPSAITVTVTIPYPAAPQPVGVGVPTGPTAIPIGGPSPAAPPVGAGVGLIDLTTGNTPPAPPGYESATSGLPQAAPASPR